jgi:hypothetical protein
MPRGSHRPSQVFNAILREAEATLSATSGGAKSFEHKGIRGDERAASLRPFLEQHLPSDFSIGKGEILDFGDRRSRQIDLFIYDRSASSPIVTGAENLLLPCEAVYAVVEVKTRLSQDELDTAYLNAASVRRLRPFKCSFVGARTDGRPADDSAYRCMYTLLAFESNLGDKRWLDNEYARAVTAAAAAKINLNAIDRIVVLGRGIISTPNKTGRDVTTMDRESVFFEFYMHLANFLNRERLRRPPVDWQTYSPRSVPGWRSLG